MTPAERCLEEAAKCERMSRFSRTNKAVWRRMAERWRLCAELECTKETELRSTKERSRRTRPAEEASLQ
jgi:hypothetical protein